jgi:phage gp36-like protein
MSYCTRQDLIDRFGEDELVQLTDRQGSGIIDDATLTRAIADADDEINAWLSGRYALPLAVVPSALARVACDIARYYLYDDAMIDLVENRYKQAIEWLKAVGSGRINLVTTNDAAAGPLSGPVVQAPAQTFTDTLLAKL